MATNRADTLDPALLRPGRLDRKIEFPQPDRRQKRLVFAACTAKMNLSEVSEFVPLKEGPYVDPVLAGPYLRHVGHKFNF